MSIRQPRELSTLRGDFRPPLEGPAFVGASTEAPPLAPRAQVNLSELEKELTRSRLDDIANLVRSLTYGEMIDLAEGLWNVHDRESAEDEITEKTLPEIWWKWSTNRHA